MSGDSNGCFVVESSMKAPSPVHWIVSVQDFDLLWVEKMEGALLKAMLVSVKLPTYMRQRGRGREMVYIQIYSFLRSLNYNYDG